MQHPPTRRGKRALNWITRVESYRVPYNTFLPQKFGLREDSVPFTEPRGISLSFVPFTGKHVDIRRAEVRHGVGVCLIDRQRVLFGLLVAIKVEKRETVRRVRSGRVKGIESSYDFYFRIRDTRRIFEGVDCDAWAFLNRMRNQCGKVIVPVKVGYC